MKLVQIPFVGAFYGLIVKDAIPMLNFIAVNDVVCIIHVVDDTHNHRYKWYKYNDTTMLLIHTRATHNHGAMYHIINVYQVPTHTIESLKPTKIIPAFRKLIHSITNL